MRRSDAALVLFTLAPRAEGRRKSLPAAVVAALIGRVKDVSSGLPGVDFLVCSPSSPPRGVPESRHLPQRGRDFGESLGLVFEDAFALGYRRVVVIGNDAPEISTAYLGTAFGQIADGGRAAVIGPAEDGGYNLIGLTAPCPEIFAGMLWGSDRVGAETERRLLEADFVVFRLDSLPDIDDASALGVFAARAERLGWALKELARRLLALAAAPSWRVDSRPWCQRPSPASVGLLRAPPV